MQITITALRSLIKETLEKELAENVPNVLYHATRERNVPSILSQGLIPAKNWDTPEPAVFFIEDALGAIDMYEIIGHYGRPALFALHVDRLPHPITFYNDVTTAYWTPDHVPAEALELLKLSDFDIEWNE